MYEFPGQRIIRKRNGKKLGVTQFFAVSNFFKTKPNGLKYFNVN